MCSHMHKTGWWLVTWKGNMAVSQIITQTEKEKLFINMGKPETRLIPKRVPNKHTDNKTYHKNKKRKQRKKKKKKSMMAGRNFKKAIHSFTSSLTSRKEANSSLHTMKSVPCTPSLEQDVRKRRKKLHAEKQKCAHRALPDFLPSDYAK